MLTGKDCFSGYLIPSILVHSLDYLLFFLSLIELIQSIVKLISLSLKIIESFKIKNTA
jgi:hypothetical protein